MGNILTSSIGKKLIMSLTGLFLIFFLLIHLLANSAYLFGPEAFDTVIEFMGSPFIVVMVPMLAAGFVVHIAYAVYLTLYNMRARGSERYEVTNRAKTDSWASRNMFVLGIIIGGFLAFHLTHFWAKMQLAEFIGGHAQNGNDFQQYLDSNLLYHLVCRPVVPPNPRLLERIPNTWRKQRQMAGPPQICLIPLRHNHLPRLLHNSSFCILELTVFCVSSCISAV